ncbi:MAG: hypothetical protein MRZ79_21495 [Bacteroidia bacterium]|nr:hypothetical protein [Bacteroidia bacterium]
MKLKMHTGALGTMFLLLAFVFDGLLMGQIVDYQNVVTVILDDGTPVIMYGAVSTKRMSASTGRLSTKRDLPFIEGKPTPRQNQTRAYAYARNRRRPSQSISVGSAIAPIRYSDGYYFSGEYFYLPTNLRLAKGPDGTPNFLFLKYTTDEKADAGGTQGALMHFLMEWGLTSEQEQEAQQKLEEKIKMLKQGDRSGKYRMISKPVLKGPIKLTAEEEGSFEIVSATLQDKTLAPTVVKSSRAPTLPGQKIAAAANLDKNGAQLLAATFEKNRSITDLSIECFFKYKVLAPAVQGKIRIDWVKMYNNYFKDYEEKETKKKYSHTQVRTKRKKFLGITYHKSRKTRRIYKNVPEITNINLFTEDAMSAGVIDFTLDNFSDPNDPIAKNLIETFTQMLLDQLSFDDQGESVEGEQLEDPEKEADGLKESVSNYRNYKIDVQKIKSKMEKGVQIINMNYRSAFWETVGITDNLATWYDGVRNNPKCVSSVNLNDPFFQHRDINFILDLEAEEIFSKEINYATVNVRKRRSSGSDFKSSFTMGRDYLRNEGTLATVSYARGDDRNSDLYEYKVQWSLKGGNIYPENPQWVDGDWQGVTLAAPLKPRSIEFEADLDEMRELGVTRATLQVRYQKFGKEVEENIPLTVSKNEPLVSSTIYQDREMQGYVYRLVLNHKEHGKLALDWEAKINDDYVYAVIPDQLREKNKEFILKLVQAGRSVLKPGADGSVNPKAAVLDKFAGAIELFLSE